jgi:fibro-slime domain-containing protein
VYDARYDSSGNATNQVKANLWFGMRTDVQFGLPDTPGVQTSTGEYGNKDIYGNDMHFKFTGDDDVWILVDGKVVLDLGGIHQAAEGEINFSTGEVTVNGTRQTSTVTQIQPGVHTLSILYLERGSSMSNCAIYFNLAPQFALTLQKEDVLTGKLLDGAVFAFYEDQACATPCALWASKESFANKETGINEFTVTDGKVYIWGLNPSHTYYIREESPPAYNDGKEHPLYEQYSKANGIIRLTLDKTGVNSNSIEIVEELDASGNPIPISEGFTIHDFRIDDESQSVYLTVTNAQNWISQTTSVYVRKQWNDTEDHSRDSVTVYLNVTENGQTSKYREATLSKENNWSYLWTNLPKYPLNPDSMEEGGEELIYTVSEAYVPGYTPQITEMDTNTYTEVEWEPTNEFVDGEKYLLKVDGKCISTVAESSLTLCLVSEAEAKTSPLALWTATVEPGYVKLTNQAGKTLTYYASGWTRYFTTTVGSKDEQKLISTEHGDAVRLSYGSSWNSYYIGGFNSSNGYFEATSRENSASTIQPLARRETTTVVELDGLGYCITNTPLTEETSLKVYKRWEGHNGKTDLYEKAVVTVRLFSNGKDTGRTETISLKTNWMAEFTGLPYRDEFGEPNVYTVVEEWDSKDWNSSYGEVTATEGEIPTYEVTVINTYRWANAKELPATGGIGYPIFMLCGLILTFAPLVYGLRLRHKYRKGAGK